MTFILQHDDDILNFHEFNTESEARDWAKDNILDCDIQDWTLFDPEGRDWCVR